MNFLGKNKQRLSNDYQKLKIGNQSLIQGVAYKRLLGVIQICVCSYFLNQSKDVNYELFDLTLHW